MRPMARLNNKLRESSQCVGQINYQTATKRQNFYINDLKLSIFILHTPIKFRSLERKGFHRTFSTI